MDVFSLIFTLVIIAAVLTSFIMFLIRRRLEKLEEKENNIMNFVEYKKRLDQKKRAGK